MMLGACADGVLLFRFLVCRLAMIGGWKWENQRAMHVSRCRKMVQLSLRTNPICCVDAFDIPNL